MAIILLLSIAGILLIFLEFFLPGAVLAVLGSLALLVSIGLFFAEYPALWGIGYMFSILLAVFLVCKFALWRLQRGRLGGKFFHGEDQEGYTASTFDSSLIGKEGIVSTELKPAGYILVDGKQYQALSETGFISKDTPIQIISGKGSHLIVRPK